MPAEPLFDISAIDQSRVALSAEEVGALNPQCGDMRQLDHVIWINDEITRAMGVKRVSDDEFWVPGHIPGRPLLPGVLMIEAAAQLSSILFRSKTSEHRFLGFTRCDKVVFRAPVVPGDTLLLLCEVISMNPRRFVLNTQGLVKGEIVFEAQITGMVLGGR